MIFVIWHSCHLVDKIWNIKKNLNCSIWMNLESKVVSKFRQNSSIFYLFLENHTLWSTSKFLTTIKTPSGRVKLALPCKKIANIYFTFIGCTLPKIHDFYRFFDKLQSSPNSSKFAGFCQMRLLGIGLYQFQTYCMPQRVLNNGPKLDPSDKNWNFIK